jgi:thiamine-phosphate pyrophosphorylase
MRLPRFYPILDTSVSERLGMKPEAAAAIILEAGARILQFRHKGDFSRAVFAQAEQIARLCRQAGAQLVVNDRADIAALLDAGLHVGQEDLPPGAARRILGPERLLGLSTHNAAQLAAAEAEPVDYVAAGPIFATMTKERPDPVVGLEQLASLRRLTRRPLVAIGGITRQNAAAVLAAGADSVAVIADALCEPKQLRGRIEEWIRIAG